MHTEPYFQLWSLEFDPDGFGDNWSEHFEYFEDIDFDFVNSFLDRR